MATVNMIINYDCTAIMIVNYDPKFFKYSPLVSFKKDLIIKKKTNIGLDDSFNSAYEACLKVSTFCIKS
jgi:hypothetical protein